MCLSTSPGPDWMDVKKAMKEVERVHDVTVSIHILPDGYASGPTLRVSVVASLPRLDGNGMGVSVGVGQLWPCMEHATMPGLVHRLLYQLDHRIGAEEYSQESFT